MKNFQKLIIPFAIFPFQNRILAQKKDSIPRQVVAFVTDKFPQTRDLNVEFTQLTPYKYSSQLYGSDLQENKVKSLQQVKVNTNFYFIKNAKWMLSTSLNYKYTSINTEQSTSIFSEEKGNKQDFHYHTESLSLTRFSKLFGKTAVYSATASVDGSEQHFERIRGMLTGSVVVKANAKTTFTVGLAALIDPSGQIPVFPLPVITYKHRFDNGWVADIILPSKIMMRKNVFQNGRVSIGTEMDNTAFYIYNADKRYEFRQLEINSGAIYEHKLGANFIGTLKAGMRSTPNARIFRKEDTFKDYIFDASVKSSFYFNIGVSYNPFGKPRKK
ncbi:hypothetical protein NG800_001515 [Epilithonimonas ginsengisoli]|uniref:Outer membrane protein beta-barrel domain-containing protein n=1 Tax=Epilithonimonas ginsengisoli TaxID=1245592 RepID=A0ABU4JD40_9FLAO|nr:MULTISPECIES: DUF6268 family outer membrane beta-barrel protein [Chryseobacterium group]MBV6878544.1 hypothetical protein [Epilithonimonas sp. FP105]MDW8547569.1 hypothetical protein [Epilithonimonas ginsengisoli]OAH75168.1 hypothetical protein AXA65_04140 [Chryseobacterium sp. FP211-J200]